MAKKSKTKGNILKKQKPKKRRREIPIPKKYIAYGIFTATFLSLAGYTWHLSDFSSLWKKHQIPLFYTDSIEDLSLRKNVDSLIERQDHHTQSDLKKLSSLIQKHISAKRISLVSPDPQSVIVQIEMHQPIAVINFGSKRLLSRAGKIFGKFNESDHHHLPMITGIAPDSKIQLNPDQSVLLDRKISPLVKEALLLIKDGLSYNINYRGIHLDKYRGFQVLLSEKRIRVEMGRAPFKQRYKKLTKILSDLNNKNVNQARIELDFHGKAFVKEFAL